MPDKRLKYMNNIDNKQFNTKEQLNNTVLNESILNWYEFGKDKELLQLGADNKYLVELFARRCENVTVAVSKEEEKDRLLGQLGHIGNLEIVLEDDVMDGQRGFDYVVALDQLDNSKEPVQTINKWVKLLKEKGTLLLGVDNRFGLKYFCGSGEKHSDIPFDGINGYIIMDDNNTGRSYSKQELCKMFQEIGDINYKFYYPVPDNRVPQMVFTDSYQKGINASERLIDYNYERPEMIGLEHRIFSQMIDGKALPFMSNYYLVELTKEGNLSDIQYAVMTTDRGPKYGMATTIRDNKKVYKRPLWSQGEKSLETLYEYTRELLDKKIPVVNMSLEKDSVGMYIEMPFVDQEGLSTCLEKMSENNKDTFVSIFDQIYSYIKKSYENNSKDGRVFLDLAPCNAFYMDDGSVLFYDQEFVSDDGTLEFAMYRTLKYFFQSSPKSRENIDVRELYRRYNIREDMINVYEEKETAFIQNVRNKEQYQWLYKMATPNYKKIVANMYKHTESKKEYNVGYVPGVYDLFHTGHLRLFERCKERCNYLIVGVLTDELVEYYKGKKPVISYENRARVIEGLKVVDEVIPVDFNNTDKIKAWEQLHYDCHFSGDDHIGHWNDIIEELRKRGSNMEFFSYTEGISSTAIKKKMQE